MAVFQGRSRAPLIPLDSEELAVNKELILKRTDTTVQLLAVVVDNEGQKHTVDIVKAITDGLVDEIRQTKQYIIASQMPEVTQEPLWLYEEEFNNETGTMVDIEEYQLGEEIHQL